MKKKLLYFHTVLSFALLFMAGETAGQTRTYKVEYEQDGFKGYVELKVNLFANGDFSSVTFNISSASKVVVNSYKNGKYKQLLAKKGITFPHTIQAESMSDRLVDIKAQAFFYSTPQMRAIAAYGEMRRNLCVDNSTGPAAYDAEFSKEDIDYLKNYYKNHNTNLWTLTGKLGQLTVQQVYFDGFDDQVEKIIYDFQQAEQAKKQAEQEQAKKQAEQQQKVAEQKQQSLTQQNTSSTTASSSGSNNVSYSRTSQSGGSASSSNRSSGPYKDPALNAKYEAQRQKRLDNQRKIAAMKAKMERQRRDAARLDAATDRAFDNFDHADNPVDFINASKPMAMEFARQGNAAGAYTSIGVGVALGGLKALQAGKAKREARERAEEERRRIEEKREAERKRREAERERLRREAFALLISQRHTILDAFAQHDPIPLSTTHVEGDTIYYFIYAYDPITFEKKKTNVYVSNVFAIARYRDGTWPYQSSIDNETKGLTPYNEVIHGFYLDAEMANNMRKEFINGFNGNEGVSVLYIAYRTKSMKVPEDNGTTQGETANGGLGIRLDALSKTTDPDKSQKNKKKQNSLGIPLGPAPKTNHQTQSKQKEKKQNSLGIPIDL